MAEVEALLTILITARSYSGYYTLPAYSTAPKNRKYPKQICVWWGREWWGVGGYTDMLIIPCILMTRDLINDMLLKLERGIMLSDN